MIRLLKNLHRDESGQSFVELAMILPILIILLTLPIDYFRYISTKTILSSAASDSIVQLNYASIASGTAVADIKTTLNINYGDRLDTGSVLVTFDTSAPVTKDYSYYVYSSALADPDPEDYWNQFEDRESNYQVEDVELQFSYELTPITFWGKLFLGSSINVQTPVYTRSLYAGGYTP